MVGPVRVSVRVRSRVRVKSNSQSSVVLGRSFSVTRNGLSVSVLLNTLVKAVSIQGGRNLGYALPMRTDYEEIRNLKKHLFRDCPFHADKDLVLRGLMN